MQMVYQYHKQIPDFDRKFFKDTLVGERDPFNMQHLHERILFAYFYAMPKIQQDPWATRSAVSGVSSVMEPYSKWLDVQLQ